MNRMLLLGAVAWTLLACGMLGWHLYDSRKHIEHLAHESASENIHKDILYRLWATEHGGVYVPVTEKTQPNPYLKDVKERDITTPSGRKLTLINPAFMTRQVHELSKDKCEAIGHITSLKPIRLENRADAWETKALIAIEDDRKEFGEIVMLDGVAHYRLMTPLFVQEPCLKCHANRGYKLGDLRGGISASVPMQVFDDIARGHTISEVRHFAVVWLLGLAGMLLIRPYIGRRINEREKAIARLEESERRTRSIVDNAPFGAYLYRLEQDGSLILIGANASADKILSVDNKQFIGMTIEEVFPPLANTHIPDTYRKVAITGRPVLLEQVAYEGKAIRGVFEVHAFQTEPNQVAVFFRDVTEQKKSDNALRASEERFRTIIDTSLEGILTIDDRAVITFTNARMLAVLGYSREEVLGRSILDLLPEEERPAHLQQLELRRRGLATEYERKFMRKDGTVAWTRASASPLFDEQGVYSGAFGMYAEVTEQKQSELKLREQQAFIKAVMDNLPVGIAVNSVDPAIAFTYMNDNFLRYYRTTRDKLAEPDAFMEAVYEDPAFREAIKARILADCASGDPNRMHWENVPITRAGEETTFISARNTPLPGSSLMISTVWDVTERHRSMNDLAEATQRLRLAADSAGLGIWDWNVKDNTMVWDDRMFELYGISRSAFPNSVAAWENGLHPEDRARAIEECSAALSGEKDFKTEFRVLHPDGTVRYLRADALIIRDADGKAVRMIGLNQDITKQHRSAAALKESEEQFRLLLHSTGEAIYGIDGSGTCTFCNPACLRLLGYKDRDELLGKNMHETMHHTRKDGTPYPLHECKAVNTIKYGAGEHIADEVFWRADGTSFPVEYWSYPQMREGRIVGAVVTFVEITERLRLEDQLRQAQKMEAVGTLAGGIAHDFNNIMMAIMGYAHLMKIGQAQEPQSAMAVDQIISSAERAAQLTQGLLAFSRKQVMRRSVLDLNEVVKSFRNMIVRLLREDIGLHLQLARDTTMINADRGQIEQVLMNLFTNARDSMPDGGRIFITTGVAEIHPAETDRYYVSAPGAYGTITVSDTGQGMDEATLGHIFEPFFTTKEVGKGTGLGLAMVYGIMKKHDGSVLVASEPGQGTTVTLYIPLANIEPAALAEQKRNGRLTGNELILLVEDDEMVRAIVRDILVMHGYAILEAIDGIRGAELFREREQDIRLVISDLIMPNKSGWDMIKELREIRSDVKALFLSGYDRSMVPDQEAESEAVSFLQKPLKPQELLAKVREILDAPG